MNAKPSRYTTCRHIKTNGRVCQSPALTGGVLCYFHRNLHHTHRRPVDAVRLTSEWQEDEIQFGDGTGEDYLVAGRVYPRQDQIQFPALEDAESVQLATSMLFQAIATGQIQFKRARLLIATLKIACINQRALAVSRAADTDPSSVPRSIVHTTQGHVLAAPAEDAPAEVDTGTVATEPRIDAPTVSLELSSLELEIDSSKTTPPPTSQNENSNLASTNTPPVSLELTSSELRIHSSKATPPPANPNQQKNLDLTHLDTRFCRRKHRPSA
jgi:hypothetical protein